MVGSFMYSTKSENLGSFTFDTGTFLVWINELVGIIFIVDILEEKKMLNKMAVLSYRTYDLKQPPIDKYAQVISWHCPFKLQIVF